MKQNNVEITKIQMNAMLGSLLGDGSISVQPKMTSAYIRWNHSSKQLEYVKAKYGVLQGLCNREPEIKPNAGYGEYWASLSTKSLPELVSPWCALHPEFTKTKTVTEEYLEMIDHPIALAWWFMDDGSRDKDHNTGAIATNGFSESEVDLLVNWLKNRWGIESHKLKVTHSSTGNTSYIISLPVNGYVAMMKLIAPYVVESMRYKTEVLMSTCAVCGIPIPKSRKMCCSPHCACVMNKETKRIYAEQHRDHINAKSRQWAAAHREQIREAARARYLEMSKEDREKLTEQSRRYRNAHRDQINMRKREWRAAHKDDPIYREQKKRQDAQYYQKLKQDPEKYEARLQRGRDYRHTEEGREAGKLYLRRRRAEKRAQDPEVLVKYQERMAHLEELANMTPEQRKEYNRKQRLANYHKRKAERTPEEAEARKIQMRERQRKYMEELKADPERYAKFLADETRRRAARKAKKLAQTTQHPVQQSQWIETDFFDGMK